MTATDSIADLLQQDIQTAIEQNLGINAECAKAVSGEVFKELQKHWGGQEVYIPAQAAGVRHQAIRDMYNGCNQAEVCKEFNISRSLFYRVIK